MPTRGSTASPRKSQSSQTSNQPRTSHSSVGGSVGSQTKKKEPLPTTGGKDIRNFFAASSGPTSRQSTAKSGVALGSGKKPISIDDSDEEEEVVETKPAASTSRTTSKHFPTSKSTPIVLDSSPEPNSKAEPQPKLRPSLAKSSKLASPSIKSKNPPPSSKASTSNNNKRRLVIDSEEEEEEEEVMPAPKKRAGPNEGITSARQKIEATEVEKLEERAKSQKSPAKVKKPLKENDKEDDAAFTSNSKVPTSKQEPLQEKKKPVATAAKTEEPEKPKPKFDYRAMAAARAAGPKNPGSKDIPEGAPNCLAGLTFVFTGELESLSRDDAIELAKRYSGKVTSAPSGKTSYVVVGENAGQSKLNKIAELKIKTLNEDEFLELIRRRSEGNFVIDEKTKAAIEKEEKRVLEQARELEKRENEEEALRKRKEIALAGTGIAAKPSAPASAQLWTTKYAPQNIKEICGNKAPVERLGQWLQDWQKNYETGFKRPGKDGMGLYRAVLISGPPGIGKTTAAHLMAKASGYNPLELNASDARSKKLVENATNIDNASLDGFLQGKGVKSTSVTDLKIGSRTCLIMDEVDGMSAGDRGGVGALNTLIKKTKIPMILICNDRTLQKMKPLQATTFNMTFRRPQPQEIRSRVLSILHKEKLKVPANVVDELIKGVNSDIRQVLNMLATFKLSKSEMDFDEGKNLIKVNEKNSILTPFTIIDRLTGPYAFSRTNKETLGDKMELYFHDFNFVPLFMQEHYLKTTPSSINNLSDPERNLKHLELVSKAADSISDGDLIDRMIHGPEQHWSLLPLHAVASTVRPASYIYGSIRSTGGPGGWSPSFPAWLGQNSKQGKLSRQLTDIQIKMRLKVSGSKEEIRQQYMPALANKLVKPLISRGQEAVEETIKTMDDYYLGKEDWDAFVELGVDTMRHEDVLKKIPTAVKTAFTRQYNKGDHPIAFHKGDLFASAKKKIVDLGPVPDNEDVFEEDEILPESETEDKEEDEEELNDYSKDKLIKAVKPKAVKGKKK